MVDSAEVDDYMVDEERVMRGADHRIVPAVGLPLHSRV
jgi:hypothetical protein